MRLFWLRNFTVANGTGTGYVIGGIVLVYHVFQSRRESQRKKYRYQYRYFQVHSYRYIVFMLDGACTEEEILQMEFVVLKCLDWGLSPMTPNAWMKIYLQIQHSTCQADSSSFCQSDSGGEEFTSAMQLLDLSMLDIGWLDFNYSQLSVSALCHTGSVEVALRVSGYTWPAIQPCVHWMSAFAMALRERTHFDHKDTQFPDDRHLQTFNIDQALLEQATYHLRNVACENLEDQVDKTGSLIPVPADRQAPQLATTQPEENKVGVCNWYHTGTLFDLITGTKAGIVTVLFEHLHEVPGSSSET